MSTSDLRGLIQLLALVSLGGFVIACAQSASEKPQWDFVYFYSAGRILQERPAPDVYDYRIERPMFESIQPIAPKMYGPFPYPPMVPLFFRLFSSLPYQTAYRLWMAITMVLYLAGITLLLRTFSLPAWLPTWALFALAISYWPFVVRALLNGHLSAVGMAAMAAALCAEQRGRPILSGLALSVCAYKPTLLVVVLPMLFVLRKWRILAAFAVGVSSMAAISTAILGPAIWTSYLQMLQFLKAFQDKLVFEDYLDLRSTVMLANRFGRPAVTWIAAVFAAIALVLLVRSWLRRESSTSSLWATALTWTILLNLYVAIYDSLLVLPAVLVTAALPLPPRRRLVLGVVVLILYLSGYVSSYVAHLTGWQPLTLCLAALGLVQLEIVSARPNITRAPTLP